MEDQRAIKPGSRVASYLVQAVLGQGGMGVVYSATHIATQKQVALKTVNAVRADRLSQIRRETQALMKLRHPGLVAVLDQGVHDGCPWYAMPLVEEQTLEDLLPALFASNTGASDTDTEPTLVTTEPVLTTQVASFGPPSSRAPAPAAAPGGLLPEIAGGQLARHLGLAQRLCEILAYVHGEGVVHRDIKPANIFVSREGTPILVDFGLAIQTAGSQGREVLDGDLRTAGSVRYMAPEQIRGELVDPRCDLYAMGCLLFELLTGRCVFEGHHQEVIRRQLHSAPPELRECVRGAPPALEILLGRLLSKDKRERPGYARDVASQLARLGAECPNWSSPVPKAKTYLYRPPLVGREEVVRRLAEVLARPLSAKRDVVFLVGESGVGKTRLALELAGLAGARGNAVVTSTCAALAGDAESMQSSLAAPLAALKPMLDAISDTCRERGPTAASELLGQHVRLLSAYVPDLAIDAPESASGEPGAGSTALEDEVLPPALARHRLFTALTESFAAFARTKPTMLIIDDLQWADELSIGALKHFGSSRLDTPLTVVATVRTEERTPILTEMISANWAMSVELERLQGSDVGRMVTGMLCMDREPEAFVEFLAEKSEGNPFFITEYLRTAVAEQILVKNDDGQWCLANSTQPTRVLCEALPLPRSMRDLVERRLGQVSANVRPVVDGAAALGREFEPALLRQVLGLDAAAAEEAFDELIARHVFEPVADRDALRFTHDKLREVPYTSLSAERRRELHARIAAALETVQSESSAEVDLAAIGRHWMEASEPARALPCLIRAGHLARQAYAVDRAIECFRGALQAATSLGETAASTSEFEPSAIAETLGDLLALRGSHAESRKVLEDALSSGGGTLVDRARRLRKIGKTWETEHNHGSALQVYNDAEQTLEQADNQSQAWQTEWVELNLHRVRVFYWLAKLGEMNELVQRVHPFVEAHGSPLQQSNYYQALVTRDFRLHRYVISPETLENARLSLRAAAASEAPVETAFARFVYGMALLFHGNLDEAQRELAAAREATRKQGDVTGEMRSLAYLLIAHRRAQHPEDVAVLANETLRRATVLDMNDYVGVAEASLGWLAFKQGQLEQALASSQRAVDSWAKLSFAYPFQWNAVLTLLAVRLDRAPLRELVQLAERLLQKELAGLPSAIADALAAAAEAHARGDSGSAYDELQSAVNHSLYLGYL